MLRLRLRVREQALREVGKAFAVGFMAAAVLWLTSGVPVVSQQPLALPSRSQTVEAVDAALASLLTASADTPILDPGNTSFISHVVGNMAWVPLDSSEWTEERIQLLRDIVHGKEEGSVVVGSLVLMDHIVTPSGELPPGTYLVKAERDDEFEEAVGVLVNEEENVVAYTKLLFIDQEPPGLPVRPFFSSKQITDTQFIIAVGTEPLSKFMPQIEERLLAQLSIKEQNLAIESTATNIPPAAWPWIAWIIVTGIRTAGAVAIACILFC